MRRVRLTKFALIGFLAYAAVPASNAVAQGVGGQPRVIGDAKLAACIDHLGQQMVQDGSARVPFKIKLEASGGIASDRQPKIIGDPVTAACVDMLAQNFLLSGAATVPFLVSAPRR